MNNNDIIVPIYLEKNTPDYLKPHWKTIKKLFTDKKNIESFNNFIEKILGNCEIPLNKLLSYNFDKKTIGSDDNNCIKICHSDDYNYIEMFNDCIYFRFNNLWTYERIRDFCEALLKTIFRELNSINNIEPFDGNPCNYSILIIDDELDNYNDELSDGDMLSDYDIEDDAC